MTDARLLDDCGAAALLHAVSAANTAAATSGAGLWLDISNFIGDVLVSQDVGVCTGSGSINGKLQAASDANGTGAADVTGATFTSVTASNNSQVYAITPDQVPSNKTFIGYVGTIAGFSAVLVSVTAHGRKRIV